MDILTHTLVGAAVGTAVSLLARPGRRSRSAILAGGLGGFLPDVDVLSRAPGFDATVGAWLGLPPGDAIYAGSHWYSHHHLTHSLVAALVAGALALALWRRRPEVAGALTAGWLAHLALDLPTPPGPWGGIQLLWPHPAMVGGWGMCWWFNNYDLLLIALGSALALGALALARRRLGPRWIRLGTAALLGLAMVAGAAQLRRRGVDYVRGSYDGLDTASIREQHRLLPEPVAGTMERADRAVWLPL